MKRLLGHGHGGHGGQDSAVRSAEAIADELRNASQLLFFGFDFLPYSAIFCYTLLYSAHSLFVNVYHAYDVYLCLVFRSISIFLLVLREEAKRTLWMKIKVSGSCLAQMIQAWWEGFAEA